MISRNQTQIRKLVEDVLRRWRRRTILRGVSLTLVAFVLPGLLFVGLQSWSNAPAILPPLVVAVWIVCVAGALILFLVRPLLTRISDRDVSLYIEERFPELEDRLNSAVELDKHNEWIAGRDVIVERLLEDGASAARSIGINTVIDQKKERILGLVAGSIFIVFVVFLATSFGDVSTGLAQIDLASVIPAPALSVIPGNAEVEQGAAQEVVATVRGGDASAVVLHFAEGDSVWRQVAMTKGVDPTKHLFAFEAVQSDMRYFVESGTLRSDEYLLSLYTFPAVDRIDITYVFPEYTGLKPVVEEYSGDIRGLIGSTVQLQIRTSGDIADGVLRLGSGGQVALDRGSAGSFGAELVLAVDDTYTIALNDRRGKQNPFPEEYSIRALEDLKPVITLIEPERDVRVNAIDEVLVAADATDDYGVSDFKFNYSINGEEEQQIDFKSDEQPRLEVAGSHMFYLEDFGLQAGDVISYYVEAGDLFHEEPEYTDMYFVEIIPFEQQFRQAANMAGSPVAAQASQTVLTQQQIITATWRLLRERGEMENDDFLSDLTALVQAQGTLKSSIESRINQTAFSFELVEDEESRKLVALLRDAVGHMNAAVGELTGRDLRAALIPERKALNALLRAEAMNREQQVAMGQQQGGAGQSASEDRMTELMDLELDISRDKYETPQQRSQQEQSQEVDNALKRIQELARKQQNLAAQTPREIPEADQKREIEKLKRDQDELRRQAEELSRAMRNESRDNAALSRRMQDDMNEVIDNMSRAEDALQRGNMDESLARQQQAVNRLDDVRRSLEQSGRSGTRSQLEELANRFERLRDGEQTLDSALSEAERKLETGGALTESDLNSIQEERENQLEELSALQNELAALGRDTSGDRRDVGREARNLEQELRRESIREMMEGSREALEQGWMDYARQMQEGIEEGLQRLDEGMRELAGSLPKTDEDRLTESLEAIRNLQDQLQRMQQATAQNQQGSPSGENPGESGQPSGDQQGQPGQGTGEGGQSSGRQQSPQQAGNQRMMERLREEVERLQEDLGGNQAAQQMMSALNRAVGSAENTGVLLGDSAKEFFEDQVYEPLSALERELVRQLQTVEMEKRLFGARSEDVPPEYRKMVERYYEALAKKRGGM